MSTCAYPYPAPDVNQEINLNSLASVANLLGDDGAMQCPLLLKELINPKNSDETRKVEDCIGVKDCTASAYDSAVLDRVVGCSAAYDNLTRADCNNNLVCLAVQSYIKRKYNESVMKDMSQQRRNVTYDQQWSSTQSEASALAFENDQPLYVTPGADLCMFSKPSYGMGHVKMPDDESVDSVTFTTVVPWEGPGNVTLRVETPTGDSLSPIGSAFMDDKTTQAQKNMGAMLSGAVGSSDYPMFSVIRAEVNKKA